MKRTDFCTQWAVQMFSKLISVIAQMPLTVMAVWRLVTRFAVGASDSLNAWQKNRQVLGFYILNCFVFSALEAKSETPTIRKLERFRQRTIGSTTSPVDVQLFKLLSRLSNKSQLPRFWIFEWRICQVLWKASAVHLLSQTNRFSRRRLISHPTGKHNSCFDWYECLFLIVFQLNIFDV